MKNLIVFVILSLFVIFFLIGLFVGVYKIFPYSEINEIKNQFESQPVNLDLESYEIINLHDIISIKNESDIILKRDQLTKLIWDTDEIPKSLPTSIENNIIDTRFSNIPNLKQIDKLTIEMKHGLNSVVYIFSPEKNNGKIILYHQGHAGDFIHGKHTIQKFIDSGFSVAAFSMPLLGLNNQPIIELENRGPTKFIKHNQLVMLESDDFSTLSYFFSPIAITLNYLDRNYSVDDYIMVGISGGGWASTIYPAVDTRISKSFSIAGSFPLSMRNNVDDVGDYEQFHPDLYSISNYPELYILNSFGDNKEFTQIFIENDPCCFSGKIYEMYPYENIIDQKLLLLGKGQFSVYVDSSTNKHEISPYTIELILNNIT